MKYISKKTKIILFSSIIFVLLICVGYITYGYMSADVTGNESSKKLSALSQILKIEYSGGNETLTTTQDGYFYPGSTIEKTFTLKNTGNVNLNYSINLKNVVNDFERTEDLIYELYLDDTLLIGNTFPIYDSVIAYNQTININETKNYTLKLIYKTSDENQIVDQDKLIMADIDFVQTKNSLSNIKILGNSIQDGTPSPTVPVEIQSVGDKTKNIFDVEHILANNLKSTTTMERVIFDGKDCLKWQNGQYAPNLRILEGKFKENTVYTISGNIASATATGDLFIVYTDGTSQRFMIHSISGIEKNKLIKMKVTSQANKTIAYLTGSYSSYTCIVHIDINSFQIEEGVTDTNYEPFGKYKIPLKVENENILDISKYSPRTGYYTDTGGSLTTSNTNLTAINPIPVEPNKQYTFTSNLTFYSVWFATASSLGGQYVISKSRSSTFTTPENCKYIYISLNGPLSNFKWAILQEGEGDGIYRPYNPLNIYLNEPLRKIGEYEDYIDFNIKQAVRKIGDYSPLNSNDLNILDDDPYPYVFYNIGQNGLVVDDQALSTHFTYQSNFSYLRVGNNKYRIFNSNSNKKSRIAFRLVQDETIVTDLTTVGTFLGNEYAKGTPVTFNYVWSDGNEKNENVELPNLYSIDPDAKITIDTTVPATIVTE